MRKFISLPVFVPLSASPEMEYYRSIIILFLVSCSCANQTQVSSDYHTLLDMKESFKFIINQPPCASKDSQNSTQVLILVHSALRNIQKRIVIRQTWGSYQDPRLRLIFMMGVTNDETLQRALEMENERFGDLVQGNFWDTYRNMTYKHVMCLKWFTFYCPKAKILLKADDDVFVNTPSLVDYVNSKVDGRRAFVKCLLWKSSIVQRNSSRWYVSEKEYPDPMYPSYCAGFIIIYSGAAVPLVYTKAQKTKSFWIDDVFITGLVMHSMDVPRILFSDLLIRTWNRTLLKHPVNSTRPLFGKQNQEEWEIRSLWRLLSTRDTEERLLRDTSAFLLKWNGVMKPPSKSYRGLKMSQVNTKAPTSDIAPNVS